MPARRQSVIATTRSRPGAWRWKAFAHGCLSASANFSTPHQKPAVGEAVSFPYKTVSKLTTVSAAVWDAALASA